MIATSSAAITATSTLEQYRVADFVKWHDENSLLLNPDFQRREVWTSSAKIYLIDTVLRRLPIPKIYIRTRIDLRTKRAFREVVDGQQRLRAILDFASDKFVLSPRAKEFAGYRYSGLPEDLQERFLSYPIAVDQLINASDSQILEVFARLNSYTVTLNAAEKRHAKYQGDFKLIVHDFAQIWEVLWEQFKVITKRARFRMQDESIVAQMFGFFIHGITEGDESQIERLYKEKDDAFDEADVIVNNTHSTLEFIVNNFEDALSGPIANAPHFLMLFAAVGHALIGLKPGVLGKDMPQRNEEWLKDLDVARENIVTLSAAIENRDTTGRFGPFVLASLSNAHRSASRRTRFPVYCRALAPRPLRGRCAGSLLSGLRGGFGSLRKVC